MFSVVTSKAQVIAAFRLLAIKYVCMCGFPPHPAAQLFLSRYMEKGDPDYPSLHWRCVRIWHWVIDPLRVDMTGQTPWAGLVRKASRYIGSRLCPVGAICVGPTFQYGCYAVIVIAEDGRCYQVTEDELLMPLTVETSITNELSIRAETADGCPLADEPEPGDTVRPAAHQRLLRWAVSTVIWWSDRWRVVLILAVVGALITISGSLLPLPPRSPRPPR